MPEKTLKAFADHGKIDSALTPDDGPAEVTLRQFAENGIDVDALASPTSGRWRQVVCKVLEGSDGCYFVEGWRIKEGELVNCSTPLLSDSWFRNQSPVGTATEVAS